jgi:hypothetical protein
MIFTQPNMGTCDRHRKLRDQEVFFRDVQAGKGSSVKNREKVVGLYLTHVAVTQFTRLLHLAATSDAARACEVDSENPMSVTICLRYLPVLSELSVSQDHHSKSFDTVQQTAKI